MKLNFHDVFVGNFNNCELLGTAADKNGICLVVLGQDGRVTACPVTDIRDCYVVKEDVTPKKKQHRTDEEIT